MDWLQQLEESLEVLLQSHHIHAFASEVCSSKLRQHHCIHLEETGFLDFAHSSLLIDWICAEEGLLAEDVTASDDITNPLTAWVLYRDQKGPIKNKVNCFDILTLFEEGLPLVHLLDLRAVNDVLECVEAYLAEHLMMEPDPFQTQQLLVCFPAQSRLLKVLYKLVHL